MEILILGLILVALMVWASTKIKKTAAAAFEEERFETDEFTIIKPEGLLIPVRDDSPLVFEAYTKDFGRDDTAAFRHAVAEIRAVETGFDAAVEAAKTAASHVGEELRSNGTGRACRLETEETEDGVVLDVFHKIIEIGQLAYHLRIAVLPEQKDAYQRSIEQMLDSFTLK